MTQHVVDALDTRINVVELGEGPLVLCLHGFPESWFSWHHWARTVHITQTESRYESPGHAP